MQKYEYCEAEDRKVTFYGSMPMTRKVPAPDQVYYNLGQAGWELVGASVVHAAEALQYWLRMQLGQE